MKYYRLKLVLQPNVCSPENASSVLSTLESWIALLSDAPYSKDKPADFDRGMRWWMVKFTSTPFPDLIRWVKDLNNQLWNSFDYSRGQVTVRYIKELSKLPIVGDIYRHFLTSASVWDTLSPVERQKAATKFHFVTSALRYGVKAAYEDESYKTILLEKWLQNEGRLAKLRFPSSLMKLMRNIAEVLLEEKSLPSLAFVHGSGMVAQPDVYSLKDKLELGDRIPASVARHLLDRKGRKPNRRTLDKGWTLQQVLNYSMSQIVIESDPSVATSVYKDALVRRGICKEPAELMQAQQGVLRILVKWFAESRLIRRSITFENQQNNAQHALIASRDGRSTTWDQSNASDNIHGRLVKHVCPARVYRLLEAVRSRQVTLINGCTVEPIGFAPMGSAVCFPTQSYIFLCTAYAAYILYWIHRNKHLLYSSDAVKSTFGAPQSKMDWDCLMTYASTLTREDVKRFINVAVHSDFRQRGTDKFMCISVYGDDCILDSRVSDMWLSICQKLGFEINESKSFGGKRAIRESCGIVAFAGYDVTPTMFKSALSTTGSNSPEVLAAWIGLANRSLAANLTQLRRYALRRALTDVYEGLPQPKGMNPLAFTNDYDDTSKIWSPYPVNGHLLERKTAIPGHLISVLDALSTCIANREASGPTTGPQEDRDLVFQRVKRRLKLSTAQYYQRTERKIVSVVRRKIRLDDYDEYRYRYAQLRHKKFDPSTGSIWDAVRATETVTLTEPIVVMSHSDDLVLQWGWVPIW